MPSAAVRLPLGAAFVVLVAVGAWLAKFHPAVLVAAVAVACVLALLVERASRSFSAGAVADETVEDEARAEPPQIEAEEAPTPVAEAEPEPEPELAVSERSARAILASGPPPSPEPARPRPVAPAVEPEPEPEPEPAPVPPAEPQPRSAEPRREWSIWELQRLIRDRPDDERQEEWAALVHSLRDFARADGTLPVEFDELVRDSFGPILATEHETEAAAAR